MKLNRIERTFRCMAVMDNGHTFIWTYKMDTAVECLSRIRSQARNPDLALTWADAVEVAKSIRHSLE